MSLNNIRSKNLAELVLEAYASDAESSFIGTHQFDELKVIHAFNKLFQRLGYEGVQATEATVDNDFSTGLSVVVTFDDDEGYEDVVFTVDDELGPIAVIDFNQDTEEMTYVELEAFDGINIKDTSDGQIIDLEDLSWANTSFVSALFTYDEYSDDVEEPDYEENRDSKKQPDPYGYIEEARKVAVIRGGKRVKLAIVKKKRRKVLTGKMKSAFRKAARKRKMKMNKINRKRKRSLRIRKRIGVKTPKLSRFQKVAGTANRKR
jgi:hypothetical protein